MGRGHGGGGGSMFIFGFLFGAGVAYFMRNQIAKILSGAGASKGLYGVQNAAMAHSYKGFAGWDPNNMAYGRYEPYAGI